MMRELVGVENMLDKLLREACSAVLHDILITGLELIEKNYDTNEEQVIETMELAFLNDELLEIEDFMKILATNNIKTFLEIKVDVFEGIDGINNIKTIKYIMKYLCNNLGIKFTTTFAFKFFRQIQFLMYEKFQSPDPEQSPIIPTYEQMMADIENLNTINRHYIKLCQILNVKPEPEAIYEDSEAIAEEIRELNKDKDFNGIIQLTNGNYMQINAYFESLEELSEEEFKELFKVAKK